MRAIIALRMHIHSELLLNLMVGQTAKPGREQAWEGQGGRGGDPRLDLAELLRRGEEPTAPQGEQGSGELEGRELEWGDDRVGGGRGIAAVQHDIVRPGMGDAGGGGDGGGRRGGGEGGGAGCGDQGEAPPGALYPKPGVSGGCAKRRKVAVKPGAMSAWVRKVGGPEVAAQLTGHH